MFPPRPQFSYAYTGLRLTPHIEALAWTDREEGTRVLWTLQYNTFNDMIKRAFAMVGGRRYTATRRGNERSGDERVLSVCIFIAAAPETGSRTKHYAILMLK